MTLPAKAQHRVLPRVVALKIMREGEYAGAEQLARFERDAAALARLDHEHIVRVCSRAW